MPALSESEHADRFQEASETLHRKYCTNGSRHPTRRSGKGVVVPMASSTRPAQTVDLEEIPGVTALVASSSTPSDCAHVGADIHEPHWRRSRMVEISSSGSGEGPGWVTSRPTLQRYFCPGVSGSAPPEPRRLDAAPPLYTAACACRAARWSGAGCVFRVPRGRAPWNGWQAGRAEGTRACPGAQGGARPSRRARRRQDHAGVG